MRSQPRVSARREYLLQSLVGIFLAEGFADVSTSGMAARLRCSKSTLYAIAPSKEQIVAAVVREFFRLATLRVETALEQDLLPRDQLAAYLEAIAGQLAPASAAFFADVDAFAPAREIYATNTRIAARRVQLLVRAANADAVEGPNAAFVGAVAGLVMEGINRGEIEATTGLDDSSAYRSLAGLIVAGLSTAVEGDDT
jgi:AcrR family transcriptional regulator